MTAPLSRLLVWLAVAPVAVAACGSGRAEEVAANDRAAVESEGLLMSEAVEPPPASAPVTATVVDPTAKLPEQEPTSTTTDAVSGITGTTSVPFEGALAGSVADERQRVGLAIESRVADVATSELIEVVLTTLNDPRGWRRAGFEFVADPASPFRVVLAEGSEADALCLPLVTYGTVSCQNGPVVVLNADRWRHGVDHWVDVNGYRGYLVNHEVGHLLGQRHPKPRCPVPGRPAGVMEQQTAGFEGCVSNPWPRDWEIARAAQRPVVYAPLPDWGPEPVPSNDES